MKTQYQQESLLSIPSINKTGLCQHSGHGWTLDPQTRLWVHPDPECWLPKHRIAQKEESVPKIISTDRPSNSALPPAAFKTPPEPEAPPLPWWETHAWPDQPMTLAVDPGDEHCGVALFVRDDEREVPWRAVKTVEMAPRDFEDLLAWLVIRGRLATVVYERFRLYADKSKEQTGSEFETSQLIGVIRWMVRKQNEHAELHVRWIHTNKKLTCETDSGCGPGRVPTPITLVGQMADIKKPARGILRFRKLKSWTILHSAEVHAHKKTCAKERCHAVDAELHGWYWLLKGNPNHIQERPKIDARHIQAAGYTTGVQPQDEDEEDE